MLKNIILAIKGACSVLGALREADAAVALKYSPAWWLEVRKQTEIRLAALYLRADKGILRHFQSDNAFLYGMMVLMKSQRLHEIYEAKGGKDKNEAVARLIAKNRTDTMTTFHPYRTQ